MQFNLLTGSIQLCSLPLKVKSVNRLFWVLRLIYCPFEIFFWRLNYMRHHISLLVRFFFMAIRLTCSSAQFNIVQYNSGSHNTIQHGSQTPLKCRSQRCWNVLNGKLQSVWSGPFLMKFQNGGTLKSTREKFQKVWKSYSSLENWWFL